MNSQIKLHVRTTSTRMQHNVKLFLSSELGHGPKRNTKILGYELGTTPLSEGMWFFFGFIGLSFAFGKFWFPPEEAF